MIRVISLVTAFFLTGPAFAAGVTIRGGGTDTPLEFINAFHTALREMKENFPDLYARVADLGLDTFPETLIILAVKTPIKVPAGEGVQDSVADNDFDHGIRVNSIRWKEVSFDRIREAIALHEILSLKKIEGTGRYPVSSAYLAKFKLQNDPQIIISGQDPVKRSKLISTRETCETTSTFLNLRTGAESKIAGLTVSSGATWHVLDKSYGLRYFFATEDAQYVPVVLQLVKTVDWVNETGSLSRTAGRLLAYGKPPEKGLIDAQRPEIQVFSEETDDGRIAVWTWSNGQKDQLRSLLAQTPLSNGSLRIYQDFFDFGGTNPGFKKTGMSENCLAEPVATDTWIQQTGDKLIAVELEKMTSRVTMVNDADRAFKGCKPANCAVLKNQLNTQFANFLAAWDALYTNRRRQIIAHHGMPGHPMPHLETRKARGVTRLPGQKKTLTSSESAALNAIEEYKKTHR